MPVTHVVCYIGACLLAVITHQSVLSLFDEEGLAVLAQLHVQTHRLPVDLDVHLQVETFFRSELYRMTYILDFKIVVERITPQQGDKLAVSAKMVV